MTRRTLLTTVFVVSYFLGAYAQLCPIGSAEDVVPFCTDENELGISYPAGVSSDEAFEYKTGCLTSSPSPQWFAFQIDKSGNLGISMEHSNGYDVDFACFGPFKGDSKTEVVNQVCLNPELFYVEPESFFDREDLSQTMDCYENNPEYKRLRDSLDALHDAYYEAYDAYYQNAYSECYDSLYALDPSQNEWSLQWDAEDCASDKAWEAEWLGIIPREPSLEYPDDPIDFDINSPCFRGYWDNFPKASMVDCSYSTNSKELCFIPNAVKGEWYLLVITNYSEMPGTISFNKTSGTATTNCNVIVDAYSTGPYCEGETIMLGVNNAPAGATFSWIGPDGFSAVTKEVRIPNATKDMAGTYSVVMVANGKVSPEVEVEVEVYEKQEVDITEHIEAGESYLFGGERLTASGVYTKTFVSEVTGCDSIVNLTLIQGIAPVVSSNGPLCEGDNLQLIVENVPDDATFVWTGPNGFTTTDKNPTIAAVEASHSGLYGVVVTVDGVAAPKASVNVKVNEKKEVSIEETIEAGTYYLFGNERLTTAGSYTKSFVSAAGCDSIVNLTLTIQWGTPVVSSNGPLCEGDNLQLTVENVSDDATFVWTGPNGFTTTDKNPTIVGVEAIHSGVYSVEATVDGVASPKASVNVKVNEKKEVSIEETIEAGTYYLFGNERLTTAGSYTKNFVSAAGCDSIVNLTLTIQWGTPVVSSNGPLCEGDNLQLTVANVPDDATFVWTGPNGFTTTDKNPTIVGVEAIHSGVYSVVATVDGEVLPEASVIVQVNSKKEFAFTEEIYEGEYYQFGTDKLTEEDIYTKVFTSRETGCDSIVTLTLIVKKMTPVEVSNNGPLCAGETLLLSVDDAPEGATFSWTGPNGFSSDEQNPTINQVMRKNAGTYKLVFHFDGRDFEAPTTFVQVNEEQKVSISASIPKGESYILGTQDLTLPGTYSETFTGNNGCDSIVTLKLTYDKLPPLIPEKFLTPNNDGIYDQWIINNVEYYSRVRVWIYDRFGKLVRMFDHYDNNELSWDGTNEDGRKLPSTDYWYVISTPEMDEEYVGHVTIVRSSEE